MNFPEQNRPDSAQQTGAQEVGGQETGAQVEYPGGEVSYPGGQVPLSAEAPAPTAEPAAPTAAEITTPTQPYEVADTAAPKSSTELAANLAQVDWTRWGEKPLSPEELFTSEAILGPDLSRQLAIAHVTEDGGTHIFVIHKAGESEVGVKTIVSFRVEQPSTGKSITAEQMESFRIQILQALSTAAETKKPQVLSISTTQ